MLTNPWELSEEPEPWDEGAEFSPWFSDGVAVPDVRELGPAETELTNA